MKKLTLLPAVGVGYVLGARAGRSATSDQEAVASRSRRTRACSRPPSTVAETAKEQAPVVADRSPAAGVAASAAAAHSPFGSSHDDELLEQLNPDSTARQDTRTPRATCRKASAEPVARPPHSRRSATPPGRHMPGGGPRRQTRRASRRRTGCRGRRPPRRGSTARRAARAGATSGRADHRPASRSARRCPRGRRSALGVAGARPGRRGSARAARCVAANVASWTARRTGRSGRSSGSSTRPGGARPVVRRTGPAVHRLQAREGLVELGVVGVGEVPLADGRPHAVPVEGVQPVDPRRRRPRRRGPSTPRRRRGP